MQLLPEKTIKSYSTSAEMNKELRVGVIVKTHGIRGEVKVYPTTDSPERFDDIETVKLRQGKRVNELRIEKVRYQKNLVLVKFKGIDDINDVEQYKGAELWIDREDGAELSEGEYYIADIIGIDVVTEDGTKLGAVKDVLETGANDVYIVGRQGGRDLLIPAIKECILNVDIEENVMTVHLLDGLLDL